mmetsp:Transcript_477/g.1876  ORF Transcript_477/g.1876 Transcript_477/m.1876 type:complete len:218 (-) Transcript_477:158-811(-)
MLAGERRVGAYVTLPGVQRGFVVLELGDCWVVREEGWLASAEINVFRPRASETNHAVRAALARFPLRAAELPLKRVWGWRRGGEWGGALADLRVTGERIGVSEVLGRAVHVPARPPVRPLRHVGRGGARFIRAVAAVAHRAVAEARRVAFAFVGAPGKRAVGFHRASPGLKIQQVHEAVVERVRRGGGNRVGGNRVHRVAEPRVEIVVFRMQRGRRF